MTVVIVRKDETEGSLLRCHKSAAAPGLQIHRGGDRQAAAAWEDEKRKGKSEGEMQMGR